MFDFSTSKELAKAVDFFIGTFTELALLFVGISFIVSFINQKLSANKVKSLLSGNRGYSVAVCLGAVTPFCSCSTLPMTIGLIKARATFGPIMAFLFTSPLLNPFIVGLFWVSFGAKTTLIYAVFVITLAVLSGYLLQQLKFDRYIRKELLAPPCSNEATTLDCQSDEGNTLSEEDRGSLEKLKGLAMLKDTLNQFISFMPYMILGVAIGALLHGYVPTSFFGKLANIASYWLIPITAIIGVFLYVRASTMVPIAAALAAKGMSMGAIISLTIGGAGASLPEMIMMKKMFHWPLLLAFIFLVFATACLTGFAIEYM
ncbi:permease [Colwellia sp. KU-HH00111]|uniref:permease n=1 Tax=Colwellia sp. KU-HH00111 TaxID=3127652 RepID=UPI003108D358